MRTGILLVDKPEGVTSAQVVARVKRALGGARVGHAGTLDPFATGLLICLSGDATRLSRFALAGIKEYEGVIRLGIVTDTDDRTGTVLREVTALPSVEEVQRAVAPLTGVIQQVPPQISAVKVDGERAYRRARAGEELTLKSRTVEVQQFSVRMLTPSEIAFQVRCTPGTYIRSLARDLGESLGCGAHVQSLRRTRSGSFAVHEAVALESVSPDALLPIDRLFVDTPRIAVDPRELAGLQHGNQLVLSALVRAHALGDLTGDLCLYAGQSGATGGVLIRESGRWQFGVSFVGEEQSCRPL